MVSTSPRFPCCGAPAVARALQLTARGGVGIGGAAARQGCVRSGIPKFGKRNPKNEIDRGKASRAAAGGARDAACLCLLVPGWPPGIRPVRIRSSSRLRPAFGVPPMEPSQSVIGAAFGGPRAAEPDVDSAELLRALMAVRNGDFSVRLPATAAESPARSRTPSTRSSPRSRVSRWSSSESATCRQAGPDAAPRPVRAPLGRLGRDGNVGQRAHRRPAPADDRGHRRASRPSRKATCRRPCRSRSRAGRSKASSCAPRGS